MSSECIYKKRRLSSFQTIILGFAGVILLGALLLMLPISTTEKIVTPFIRALFTATSAVGTVGLTLGITPKLHIPSQIVLIVIMYLGRVGGLTLIYATLSGTRNGNSRMPKEKITVG